MCEVLIAAYVAMEVEMFAANTVHGTAQSKAAGMRDYAKRMWEQFWEHVDAPPDNTKVRVADPFGGGIIPHVVPPPSGFVDQQRIAPQDIAYHGLTGGFGYKEDLLLGKLPKTSRSGLIDGVSYDVIPSYYYVPTDTLLDAQASLGNIVPLVEARWHDMIASVELGNDSIDASDIIPPMDTSLLEDVTPIEMLTAFQLAQQTPVATSSTMGTWVFCEGYCTTEEAFIPADGNLGDNSCNQSSSLSLKQWLYVLLITVLPGLLYAILTGKLALVPGINYMTADEMTEYAQYLGSELTKYDKEHPFEA